MTMFDIISRNLGAHIPNKYLANDDYHRGYVDGYFSVSRGYWSYSIQKHSNNGFVTLLKLKEDFIEGYLDGIRDSVLKKQFENQLHNEYSVDGDYHLGYRQGEVSVLEGLWFYYISKYGSNDIKTLLEVNPNFMQGYLDGIKHSIFAKQNETN